MIIKNGKIFDESGVFFEGELQIEGERIAGLTRYDGQDADGTVSFGGCTAAEDEEILDAEGLYVIPALTDIHFHGCAGFDFCDGTQEALQKIAEYQLQNGVMTICPASMTFPEGQLADIFQNAAAFRKENHEGAELVGINMEGPFISREKKGAQNSAFIHTPDADMFFRLQDAADGLIRLLDIAPETEGAMECIEAVRSNVRVSLAHTTADYDIAFEAFQRGARQVTHLYNAMPPFSHRAPGVVGAACDRGDVTVELICDGVHSHPSTVRTTFKMFGDDRIILISDSMMACGLEDGQYTLGGQAVTVCGNRATLTDEGNIAGSVTNLMNCVRTVVKTMGIPLGSAVKCAAVNPAKAISIFHEYGSLEPDKLANVVLLDENLEIRGLIQRGKIVPGNL